MLQICAPRPCDAATIEALLDRAFGPGRLEKTSYAYRRTVSSVSSLSFVAWEGRELVGTIAYWPVQIGGAGRGTPTLGSPNHGTPALLLGPLAVEPRRKGAGIGSALMHHSLSAATRAGHGIVVLVGDPDYYARFGFAAAAEHGIVMPDEQQHRLRVRTLSFGALDGVAGYVKPLVANDPAARVA